MKVFLLRSLEILKNFHVFILDLIFPIYCLSCHKEGEWLCSNCLKSLPYLSEQKCPTCEQLNQDGSFCQSHSPKPLINRIIVATSYKNKTVKDLIKKMKYQNIQDLAIISAKVLSNFLNLETKILEDLRRRRFVIMFIPMHSSRQRKRGYNQAEKIAISLAKELKLPCLSGLKKIKKTVPQTSLSRIERLSNLTNSFAWTLGDKAPENILIIDDVTTSGATLTECARVLKDKGAKTVWGLTVARNR